MKKTKISIRFFCGHFEQKTPVEIKKAKIVVSYPYVINGERKAESGQYCLICSK